MKVLTTVGLTLLVVFIVLKLTNLITWEWVWVLSPLWTMLYRYVCKHCGGKTDAENHGRYITCPYCGKRAKRYEEYKSDDRIGTLLVSTIILGLVVYILLKLLQLGMLLTNMCR